MRSVSLRKKSVLSSRGCRLGQDRGNALSARTSRWVLPDLESPARESPLFCIRTSMLEKEI